MKKISDKIQLIYVIASIIYLSLILSINIFIKKNDGSLFSFYSIMSLLYSGGLTIWICTFILFFIVLVLSVVQSFITHKKGTFCVIKEITYIFANVILCVEINMINSLVVTPAKIIVSHNWLIILDTIMLPIILYIIDYIDAVLHAK